jgi:hypothetical protein
VIQQLRWVAVYNSPVIEQQHLRSWSQFKIDESSDLRFSAAVAGTATAETVGTGRATVGTGTASAGTATAVVALCCCCCWP